MFEIIHASVRLVSLLPLRFLLPWLSLSKEPICIPGLSSKLVRF